VPELTDVDLDSLSTDDKLSIIIHALVEAAGERQEILENQAEIIEKLNNLNIAEDYNETYM